MEIKMNPKLNEMLVKAKEILDTSVKFLKGKWDQYKDGQALKVTISHAVQFWRKEYAFSEFYAYSLVVVGLLCCLGLLGLAFPGTIKLPDVDSYGRMIYVTKEIPEDPILISKAVFQFVGCIFFMYFIFSQLSCAAKLREQKIVAGSVPRSFTIARRLCYLLALISIIAYISLFFEHQGSQEVGFRLSFTLCDVTSYLSYLAKCKNTTMDEIMRVVTIPVVWHLFGIASVIKLVGDNVAKVKSLKIAGDNGECQNS